MGLCRATTRERQQHACSRLLVASAPPRFAVPAGALVPYSRNAQYLSGEDRGGGFVRPQLRFSQRDQGGTCGATQPLARRAEGFMRESQEQGFYNTAHVGLLGCKSLSQGERF
jgi:hypothetical protein